MPRADGRDIVIAASFDLLRLYREDVTVLIRTLRSAGAQRIRLTAVIPPEALHSTNVQLDSYADKRQWLFFNEPPALLFPDEIMEQLIANARTEEYAAYLRKLKSIFTGRTSKSRMDLVLYASVINHYLAEGTVSVGAGLIALLLYVWFVSTIVEDGRYLKLNNSGKIFNFYLGK